MKLSKLIKAVLPLATVSTVVPFVASCGCSTSSYSFNYGDTVNCLIEGGDNYHSMDDVASAAKDKADRANETSFSSTTAIQEELEKEVNPVLIKSELMIQNFFFDLIAGSTSLEKVQLQIKGWKHTKADDKYTIGFDVINFGTKYENQTGLTPKYRYDEDKAAVCWCFEGYETLSHKSYTYQDWKVK